MLSVGLDYTQIDDKGCQGRDMNKCHLIRMKVTGGYWWQKSDSVLTHTVS